MAVLKRLTIDGISKDLQVLTAGEGITIEDDIISAIISDLTDYYTKTEVNELVEAINEFELVEVAELPQTGEAKKLYLVPQEGGSSPNVKDEYVWLSTNAWECIGSTEIDLTNYYDKTEVDALLDDKVDKETGKGLSTNDYTDEDKAKVDGIIDYTAGENITISASGEISATDTTYENATTTTAGLMSAEDKAKLDGLDDMTKAEILTTLGYKESTIVMTDTDNNSVTKTILVANE